MLPIEIWFYITGSIFFVTGIIYMAIKVCKKGE